MTFVNAASGVPIASNKKVKSGVPIASTKKKRDKIERSARVRLRRIFEIRGDLWAGMLVSGGEHWLLSI